MGTVFDMWVCFALCNAFWMCKGAEPGCHSEGRAGVQGGNEGAEVLEDLGGGVVGLLTGCGVKVRGCQLAEFVEDCLGGRVIVDFNNNADSFQDGTEAGLVAGSDEGGNDMGLGLTVSS